MNKELKIGLLVLVLVCGSGSVFATETVWDTPSPSYGFVTYLNVGGGAAFIQDENSVLVDFSSGFQLSPWFSLGGFVAVNPLSNFSDADLGLSIADTEAAFALMSGMELLFTISPDSLLHPIMRLTVGGISIGYLEDIDGEEGYDVSSTIRSTFASITAGLELNITSSTRIALRGGWRFAAHGETMGIEAYGLGGPEISLSLRTIWNIKGNKN